MKIEVTLPTYNNYDPPCMTTSGKNIQVVSCEDDSRYVNIIFDSTHGLQMFLVKGEDFKHAIDCAMNHKGKEVLPTYLKFSEPDLRPYKHY